MHSSADEVSAETTGLAGTEDGEEQEDKPADKFSEGADLASAVPAPKTPLQ